MVMAMANIAMATGNIGREGVGVNPLRGQNNVQGSCDMGSFPHELPGYRHVSDCRDARIFEKEWGVKLDSEPGLRIPNMFDAAVRRLVPRHLHPGRGHRAVRSRTRITSSMRSNRWISSSCRICSSTKRRRSPTSSCRGRRSSKRTARSPTPSGASTACARSCARSRACRSGRSSRRIATAMGYPMHYGSAAEIMDEIARVTPTFEGVSFDKLDELGSIQWPCNDEHPTGTPVMHTDEFTRGKGRFMLTAFVPTAERTNRNFPLILTTGRILAHYNVGAQTRRTENVAWHPEDILETPSARRRGSRHQDGHEGVTREPRRRHDADGKGLRSHAARRRLHDLPPPGDRRQRHHHRELGLGDQLPRVQGDGGAGDMSPTTRPSGRRNGRSARSRTSASRKKRGWSRRSKLSAVTPGVRLR